MCRSRAEGGQRCFSHANKRLSKAQAALYIAQRRAAADPSPKNLQRLEAARDKRWDAAVDLASTPEGLNQVRVSAAYDRDLDRPAEAGMWDSIAREGIIRREQNEAIRRAMARVTTRNPLRRWDEVTAAEEAVINGRMSMDWSAVNRDTTPAERAAATPEGIVYPHQQPNTEARRTGTTTGQRL